MLNPKKVLLDLLKQGITPEKLAKSCALGICLGLFPIFGATTLLCLAIGAALQLNQPAIQAVNYFMTPVQLVMVPIFVRMGEAIYQAPPVAINPLVLVSEFKRDIPAFFKQYGMAGVHAISAWAILAPFLFAALYWTFLQVFQQAVKKQLRIRAQKNSARSV